MTNDRLEGRVVQILNERELTINLGQTSGVDTGMKFAVLAETPLKQVDPITDELLGELDREKVRVMATEVYEKFSVCRTYETVVVGRPSMDQMFGLKILQGEGQREVPKTLRADKSFLPPPLSQEESYVKIGDRVRQVTEPQE